MADISDYIRAKLDRFKARLNPPIIDVVSRNPNVLQSARARATLPQAQRLIQQAREAPKFDFGIQPAVQRFQQGFREAPKITPAITSFAKPAIARYKRGYQQATVEPTPKVRPRDVLRELGSLPRGLMPQYATREEAWRNMAIPLTTDSSGRVTRAIDMFGAVGGIKSVGKGKAARALAQKARKYKSAEEFRKALNPMPDYAFPNVQTQRAWVEKGEKLESIYNQVVRGKIVARIKFNQISDPQAVRGVSPKGRITAQTKVPAQLGQKLQPEIVPGRGGVSEIGGLPSTALKAPKVPSVPTLPKERGFVKTVREATTTRPDVARRIQGYYQPVENRQTLVEAQNVIKKKGLDRATYELFRADKFTRHEVAKGLELMRQYQNKGNKLGYKRAAEVAEMLAEKGTEAGQTVQSFAIWSRLTSEGMLAYAQKLVRQANAKKLFDKSFGQLRGQRIKLTTEATERITLLMKRAEGMAPGKAKDELVREAMNTITKQIPLGVNELIDAYRYTNMLSNPLTHLRNIYSNLFQLAITRPGTIAIDAGIDFVRFALKGEGKQAAVQLKRPFKYYAAAFNSHGMATEALMEVLKGKVPIAKPDIRVVRNQNLPLPLRIIPGAMEGMDRYFSTLLAAGEYQNQLMKGVGKDKAAKLAREIAEYSLFRQNFKGKGQGIVLDQIDNTTKWMEAGRGKVPGLKWFIPFIRTPMNFAKQWIEYSPIGLLNLPGAARKQEQIAKVMFGSAAMGIGAHFAMNGQTTWAAPSDPKAKDAFYAAGRKPFSVRVGNAWVPAIYFGPFALSLMLPAAVKYYHDESPEALSDDAVTKLFKVTMGAAEFWSQQTFTSGIQGWVRLLSGDLDYSMPANLAYTAGQLKPLSGLVGYITRALDPVYRKVPSGTFTEKFIDSVQRDLPYFSSNLPAHTNPLQEESIRNMSNYFAPFSVGLEDQRFEELLQSRMLRLQDNARERQIEKQLEEQAEKSNAGQIDDDKYYYFDMEVGTVKTISLDPIQSDGSRFQEIKGEKERYRKASEILDNDFIPDEDKELLLGKIGISQENADYYVIAKEENAAKTGFVLDLLDGVEPDNVINTLVPLRKELAGKMLLADGVIGDLYDEGIITASEKKYLKSVKIGKTGEIKITAGKAKKPKKPKKLTISKVSARKAPAFKRKAKARKKIKLLKIKVPSPVRIKARTPKMATLEQFRKSLESRR